MKSVTLEALVALPSRGVAAGEVFTASLVAAKVLTKRGHAKPAADPVAPIASIEAISPAAAGEYHTRELLPGPRRRKGRTQ